MSVKGEKKKKKTKEEKEIEEKKEEEIKSKESDSDEKVEKEETEEDLGSTKEESEEQVKINELEGTVKKLEEQLINAKESELRSLAELENFKKRKQQEVDTFKKYASENVILEILPILDSFDHACSHATEEITDNAKKVIDGFILIQKQLHTILEKLNVTPINAENQKFDHNVHQAISQEKVDNVESGIVIKEMQKGYQLYDRVIRPAMVVVSE